MRAYVMCVVRCVLCGVNWKSHNTSIAEFTWNGRVGVARQLFLFKPLHTSIINQIIVGTKKCLIICCISRAPLCVCRIRLIYLEVKYTISHLHKLPTAILMHTHIYFNRMMNDDRFKRFCNCNIFNAGFHRISLSSTAAIHCRRIESDVEYVDNNVR